MHLILVGLRKLNEVCEVSKDGLKGVKGLFDVILVGLGLLNKNISLR